jgi:uncharacterized phage protein gp47/JayE
MSTTTTYPLSTLGPTISSTGITAPALSDIYQSLIATFQSIYGSDIYVTPDSQDGQWIGALSSAINDCNQACIGVYQSFSPSYAQGTQLSSLVKINGLQRDIATNSQAVGNVVGVAGTVITNGIVADTAGNLWNLPNTVTIPLSGSISVTVTAQALGALSAAIGDINKVYNPQLGWQSFTNTSIATEGSAVEEDGQLRTRQASSTALPALGIIDSISAAVGNVSGVNRYFIYENATGSTDGNGVPAHSIAPIVEGGQVAAIAQAIWSKKPPGIQTYGSTSVPVTDVNGFNTTINFFELTEVPIFYSVTVQPLPGFVATTGTEIVNALVAFTTALEIGDDIYVSQASAIASLIGQDIGQTFYISSFTLGTSASPVGTGNITINFNAAATCTAANVVVTVA